MDFFKKLRDVFIKKTTDTSAAGEVNTTDIAKLVMVALLTGASAGVAVLIEHASSLNLGEYTAFAVPVILFVLQYAQKWLKNNTTTTK